MGSDAQVTRPFGLKAASAPPKGFTPINGSPAPHIDEFGDFPSLS